MNIQRVMGTTCTLHVVHNAFHEGIKDLEHNVNQFSFDLHAWFKISPCKQEDFRNLVDGTDMSALKSLFLRHVSTRWLTLVPVLERILLRWDSAKEYFLTFLPDKEKKEYTNALPKNTRYFFIFMGFFCPKTTCKPGLWEIG